MPGTKLRKPLILSGALRPRYASRGERLKIRATYAEKLEQCRRVWEATQDPAALDEAIKWTFHFRQPLEPWIEEAMSQVLMQVRSSKVAKRHRENFTHLQRYTCVRDLHARGLTWDEAKEAAVNVLAEQGHYIDTDTVWRSYKRVRKDMRERRTSRYRYWYLKDTRYYER